MIELFVAFASGLAAGCLFATNRHVRVYVREIVEDMREIVEDITNAQA